MPVKTGVDEDAMALATRSSSKHTRSPFDPPPRTTQMRSTPYSSRAAMAAAIWRGARLALDDGLDERDGEAERRVEELAGEVVVALGARDSPRDRRAAAPADERERLFTSSKSLRSRGAR